MLDNREVKFTQGRGWLEKMDGYLNWKVIGPDINNPYGPMLSHAQLLALAYDEAQLKRQFVVRCMCEGYEVLQIRNLNSPLIVTDHPCLTSLTKFELSDYLEEEGISDRIQEEVIRIQTELRQQLDRNEVKEKEESDNPKKKKSKKVAPEKPADSQFRIMRK